MSFWDDFVQAVQGAGSAVGSTFLKAIGAQPGATLPLAQSMVQQEAVKSGMSPETAQALTEQSFSKVGLKDAEQVGTQVVTPLDKYVYQPTFQALSAGVLLTNPDTWTTEDQYTNALSRAWNSRQDIPFGNAVADMAAYYANKLPDWGPLADLNQVDVNIYNKELREKIYLRMYDEQGNRVDSQGNVIPTGTWIENAFMGLSGATDFAKQLVFDPLVLTGKAAKAARLKVLNVRQPEAVVRNTEAFNTAQAKAAKQTNRVYQDKLDLVKFETELGRVQNLMTRIDSGTATQLEIIREVDNVRMAEGFNPLPEGTKIDAYVKEYKTYAAKLEKDVAKKQANIEKLNVTEAVIPEVASGVKEFVTQVVQREMRWDEIAKHAVIKNYAVDPEFLSKAIELAAKRGENAAYDVFLLSQGEPTAALRLSGQHADLVKIIDDAQSRLDDIELKIQESIYQQDPRITEALNIQKKKTSELISAMRSDDAYLDYLVGPNSNVAGTMPTMPFSGNVTVKGKDIQVSPMVEKFRADKAIVRAGLENGTIKLKELISPSQEYLWTRVQKSPLHRAVYVAQWIGYRLGKEKPAGWVTFEGLDAFEGVREMRVMMEDAKILDGMTAIKDDLMNEYVLAKDGPARQKVMDKVEKTIIQKTAEYFNVSDIKIKDADGVDVPLADVLFEKFMKDRAQEVIRFKKDKVFGVDSNQTMLANPIAESQLDYSRPMIDANELFKFFKYNIPDKTKGTVFAGAVKKIKDEWVMPTWVTVDKLWRADVLLRLGYPKKNIAAELTVLSMYDFGLRGMFSNGTVSQAMKNFLDNRHAQFIDMREGMYAEIDMANKTGGNTTLAMLRGILPKRVNWTKYEEFASDTIKVLREQKEAYANLIKEVAEHPDAYDMDFREFNDTIDGLDELIAIEEAKLQAISDRVVARGDRFGSQKIIGKKTVTVGAHEFAGIYEGMQGKAVQILTGAGGRLNFDISPFKSLLKDMGLETTDNWRAIYPDEKTYFITLADILNKQFRGSNTISMMLRGEPMQNVLAYLESPRGKAELEKLNWIEDQPIKGARKRKAGWPLEEEIVLGKDANGEIRTKFIQEPKMSPAESYYYFIKDEIISTYLPNEAMRELVKKKYAVDELGRGGKDITSAELRVAAKDTQLNPIHGQAVDEKGVLQNPNVKKQTKLGYILMDVIIKNGYRFLGEFPEDAAITHPFGNAVYQAKLKEITDMWEANKIMPTNMDKLKAQTVARKWAIQQTREFLYRVTRRNGISAAIPVIAPFLEAQVSTFRRVGRLAYRNPDKAARLVWLWNQINTNAYEDEDGKRWLTFTIPKEWYDDKGISSIMPEGMRNAVAAQDVRRWSPQQFNLILMGLRIPAPELLPGQEETIQDKVARWAQTGQSIIGTGWTVQILANEILKANPYIDQAIYKETGLPFPARDVIEMFASPYPSNKWYDPLTSAWNKRVISLFVGDQADTRLTEFVFGKNNADFERTQLMMVQYHLDQQRLGLEEPLSDNPKENAQLLFEQAGKEASWNIALRLFSNLTSGFISSAESSRITPLIEEYRRYQTKYGVQAYDKWLEAHPDLAYITISRSRNLSGSSQSVDAAWLRKEHDGMIEDAIKATGLPREEALAFVQMVTNKNIDAPVLRDPYAGYWQRQIGDRVTISAEEGFENTKIREGWSWFMDEQDKIDARLKELGITRYSSGADEIMRLRDQRILEYGATNDEWYSQYLTLAGAKAANGFIKAMYTALDDEYFVSTLPEDSFWFGIEAILNERADMIQSANRRGFASPSREQRELYAERIAPYLANPTTAYYFNKFMDNDPFDLVLPGENK